MRFMGLFQWKKICVIVCHFGHDQNTENGRIAYLNDRIGLVHASNSLSLCLSVYFFRMTIFEKYMCPFDTLIRYLPTI